MPEGEVRIEKPVQRLGRVIRQDHSEIQIAVRTGVTAGFGAKKVDTMRLIELDQPTGYFGDGLVFGHDLLIIL